MKSNNESCYLTFKTDIMTAHLLTALAHQEGKTQPELINDICKIYIAAAIGSGV